jgi:hypothetical protein
LVQWLISANQHNSIANRHNLTHNSKTTRLIKKSIISIGLTVYTKDEAVGMTADNTISVEEASTVAMATMKMAIIAMATVAMTTMAAITTTVAQTREA